MDGGLAGSEGLRSERAEASASGAKPKGIGSEPPEEQQWRATKVLRAYDGLCASESSNPVHHGTPLMRSERILNFSSPRPEVTFLAQNASGYGSFAGSRGLFTPSQWVELEHQALIYKYLNANIPVPSNLLIPIRRSFNAYGLSVGWGSFHLGFSDGTNRDVGRCRRTDGKKWRCAREAVADQKYCEKHLNRGRHRSRKPVEGQLNGRAAATSEPSDPKMVSVASSSSYSVGGSTGGGLNDIFSLGQNQFNRMLDPRAQGLSVTTSVVSPKLDNQTAFTLHPEQEFPVEDCAHPGFELVSSSSLVNPLQTKGYGSFLDFTDMDPPNHQQPLHQFVDSWSEAQLNSPIITRPEDLKSDRTQVSMSIPLASSNISSSASSPLVLSHELDKKQEGLGESYDLLGYTSQKHSSSSSNSWEASLCGPLGEALIKTSICSSPTGVLQQNAGLGSQSTNSSGSSPVAINTEDHESPSLFGDMFCPTVAAIHLMWKNSDEEE